MKHPEGSVLVSCGETRVLCNVSVEESVPRWMIEQGKDGGWITAEYSMLPRSTHTRNRRETNGPRARSQEIQRLIGRALRASFNLELLGPRSFMVDCDVLQADGGTRTASITGAYVALRMAMETLIQEGMVPEKACLAPVAAISVGMIGGEALLDLCYEEDVAADVDANFVMNKEGNLIEIQGTAEGQPFSVEQYNDLLSLAQKGIAELIELQETALASVA